jgi:hypothetical protein
MPDRRAVCLTCRHWCGKAIGITTTYLPGECRASPPSPSGWPITKHDDWCGAHDMWPPTAEEMGKAAR